MKLKFKWPSILVFLNCILLSLPHLFTQLHWDEFSVYSIPLFRMNAGDFAVWLNPQTYNYHPDGFHWLLFPLVKIFGGPSALTIKLFVVLINSLAMGVLFLIGTKLKNWKLGLFSVVLCLGYSAYYVSFSKFLGDSLLASFSIFYLACLVYKRYWLAILIGVFMGSSRETAIAFGVAGFFWFLAECDFKWKSVLVWTSPFIGFCGFLSWHLISYGAIDGHPAFQSGHIGINEQFLSNLMSSLQFFFLHQGKWIFFLAGAGISLYLLFRKIEAKLPLNLFSYAFSLFFVFILFFSFHSEAQGRYFLPTWPLVSLMVAWMLCQLKMNRSFLVICVLLIAQSFYFYSRGYQPASGYESTLDYKRIIELHQKIVSAVESKYSDKTIATSWPLTDILGPYGYSAKKVVVEDIGEHFFDFKVNTDRYFDKLNFEVFIWSSSSASHLYSNKIYVVDKFELKLLESIEVDGGHWAEIYGYK